MFYQYLYLITHPQTFEFSSSLWNSSATFRQAFFLENKVILVSYVRSRYTSRTLKMSWGPFYSGTLFHTDHLRLL